MKLAYRERIDEGAASRPARGAWIEISAHVCHGALTLVSRPARGAWIEIGLSGVQIAGEKVAPREGRVD